MNLTEQVMAQAGFMAQELAAGDNHLLETVCKAAVSSLKARLRDDVAVEDCQADLITAAGMLAVAALADIGDWTGVEQLTAGDFMVRRKNSGSAVEYLRSQAEMLMAPYLKSNLTFLGV